MESMEMNKVVDAESAPTNMHQEAYQAVAKAYRESMQLTKDDVLARGYN
jgi:hypothetical protein